MPRCFVLYTATSTHAASSSRTSATSETQLQRLSPGDYWLFETVVAIFLEILWDKYMYSVNKSKSVAD